MRVRYDPADHTYACADTGRELLGVSQVLRLAGIVDPGAYAFPAAAAAAERGTEVHAACELLDAGLITLDELAEEHRGYGTAWEAFLRDTAAKVLHSELVLGSTVYGYAGRVDRLLVVDGHHVVADIKTSAAPAAWWGLQLEGYRRLAVGELGLLWQRAKRWTVRLTAAGNYRVEAWSGDGDVLDWCAAVRVAWWKRRNGGK